MINNIIEVGKGMRQLEEMFDGIDLETLTMKEIFFIECFRKKCLSVVDKIDDKLELTEEESLAT